MFILCTGSQGEPMAAMMRISSYTHPDVFIEKDDAVIFSSKLFLVMKKNYINFKIN